MKILSIETSCDETSVAVVEAKETRSPSKSERKNHKTSTRYTIKILSHVISSQIKTHAKFGGVVPEVAARKHAENFMGVFELAIGQAHIKLTQLDAVAVTYGPGLVTSLMVGISSAQTLAYALSIPLIPVNHMKGHIYSSFIHETRDPQEIFPALVLTVSGGHTELVLMRGYEKFKKIGQTLDDAAGEAFDKIAKMLSLPYPGGPEIAKHAESGDHTKYDFPRPLLHQRNFDFSFAGLKTSVLYFLRDQKKQHKRVTPRMIMDISASVQQAIVDCLVGKTIRAAKQYKVQTVILGGGVSANKKLREALESQLAEHLPHVKFMRPDFEYCTDNAAMIAVAGYFQYQGAKDKKKFLQTWKRIDADPTLEV